jgi:hypothetical protein
VEIALSLNNLAVVEAARGRRTEALCTARAALAAFRAACGPHHPSTRAAAANVAKLAAPAPHRRDPR